MGNCFKRPKPASPPKARSSFYRPALAPPPAPTHEPAPAPATATKQEAAQPKSTPPAAAVPKNETIAETPKQIISQPPADVKPDPVSPPAEPKVLVAAVVETQQPTLAEIQTPAAPIVVETVEQKEEPAVVENVAPQAVEVTVVEPVQPAVVEPAAEVTQAVEETVVEPVIVTQAVEEPAVVENVAPQAVEVTVVEPVLPAVAEPAIEVEVTQTLPAEEAKPEQTTPVEENPEVVANAAARIQRVTRSYLAKVKVKELKNNYQKEMESMVSEESAAVQIQAAFKSHRVRLSMKFEPPQNIV